MADQQTVVNGGDDGGGRAEIDTSAPFESVKEAVTRFGGIGFWKPHAVKPTSSTQSSDVEEVDLAKVEEHAAQLEKELILKEKDTLEVLKELEATKMIVEELRSKIQIEEYAMQISDDANSANLPTSLAKREEEEEKENNPKLSQQTLSGISNPMSSCAPGLILMELKQAKLNLTKTTDDLAEIRASVELYNRKIERERISLEKTRERVKSNSSKISSLEEEINRTRSKLEEVKESSSGDGPNDGNDLMAKLHRLSGEAEQFKKVGEAAKLDMIKVMLEIEQTKAKTKTAEMRLVAAKKMKEAAGAAEDVALAEIKALEKSGDEETPENISLTFEEYTSLKAKAQDAEKSCYAKVLEAMLEVDEANASKSDIMKRVEEAMEEVKTSKQALEEALDRVEAANGAKLAVEEALRKWRSENGEKRRSIHSSTKFKNPHPCSRRRDCCILDLNGVDIPSDDNAPVLKTTLSIGQILSRKLLITEEFESRKSSAKRKVSLAQMLGKQNGDMSSAWKVEQDGNGPKKLPTKRKKFGFARFTVLLPKQNKKKKKASPSSR